MGEKRKHSLHSDVGSDTTAYEQDRSKRIRLTGLTPDDGPVVDATRDWSQQPYDRPWLQPITGLLSPYQNLGPEQENVFGSDHGVSPSNIPEGSNDFHLDPWNTAQETKENFWEFTEVFGGSKEVDTWDPAAVNEFISDLNGENSARAYQTQESYAYIQDAVLPTAHGDAPNMTPASAFASASPEVLSSTMEPATAPTGPSHTSTTVTDSQASSTCRLSRRGKQQGETPRIYNNIIRAVPSHDFEIPGPEPVNFTAVEIIALLPKWYTNQWIARRFLNNGMTNPIHVAILRAHREYNEEDMDFKANSIGCGYRDAMRGHNWRSLPKEQQSDWIRKKHTVPEDWDGNDISVNGFVPDRIREHTMRTRRTPQPIPFKDLLLGVKKLPQGADAGDLTRVLELFAQGDIVEDESGNEVECLFPDHLQYVLEIIGRTEITPEHTDRAIVDRYAEHIIEERNKARQPRDLDGTFLKINDGKKRRYQPYRSRKSKSKTEKEADPKAGPRAGPKADPKVAPEKAPDVTPIDPTQDPTVESGHTAHNQRVDPANSVDVQDRSLIRNSETPPTDDFVCRAQIIHFAQRPDQFHLDWRWCDADIAHITRILEDEWIQQLNMLLGRIEDAQYSPLWREYRGNVTETTAEIIRFVNEGIQQRIDWRVDVTHALIMGHLDIGHPELSLPRLSELVLGFENYSKDMTTARDHFGRFHEATFEALGLQFDGRVYEGTVYSGEPAPDAGFSPAQQHESPAGDLTQGQIDTSETTRNSTDLLRECPEGDDLELKTEVARASRFARRPDQVGIDWTIGDVGMIVESFLWM